LRNPTTKREVVVRVEDRGPFIAGRDLDLSEGAALKLGFVKKGLALLEVLEVIPPAGIQQRKPLILNAPTPESLRAFEFHR